MRSSKISNLLINWRKCFEDEKYEGLTKEEEIGLFGELTFLNKAISLTSLKNMVAEFQNHLIRHGYITSVIYPKADQNLKAGHLNLILEPGLVIQVLEPSAQESIPFKYAMYAFGFYQNTVLHLPSLEQALDNLNRLPGANYRFELAPTSKNGAFGSDVMIISMLQNPLFLKVSMSYNKDIKNELSLYPHQFQLAKGNILGLLDVWNLSYSQLNREFGQNQHSAYLDVSVPFLFLKPYIQVSQFEHNSFFDSAVFRFDSTGKSQKTVYGLEWCFSRSYQLKQSLQGSYYTENQTAYIQDIKNDVGSYELFVASLQYRLQLYKALGGSWLASVTYKKGIGARDDNNTSRDAQNREPQNRFDVFVYDVSWFYTPTFLKRLWRFEGSFRAQSSNRALYSSEQIGISGYYAIRGITSSLIGDSGYVTNQTMSTDITKEVSFFPFKARQRTWDAFFGFDYGSFSQTGGAFLDGSGQGEAMSTSIGLRMKQQDLYLELLVSKPFRTAAYRADEKGYVSWKVQWFF